MPAANCLGKIRAKDVHDRVPNALYCCEGPRFGKIFIVGNMCSARFIIFHNDSVTHFDAAATEAPSPPP